MRPKLRRAPQLLPPGQNDLLLLLTRPPISRHALFEPNLQNPRFQIAIESLLNLLLQALRRVGRDAQHRRRGLKQQAADPLPDALAEACEAFLARAAVWVVYEAGEAVEHVEGEALGGYFDAAAEAGDVVSSADGVVVEDEGGRVVEAVGELIEEGYRGCQ